MVFSVILALGGNVGDVRTTFSKAVRRLVAGGLASIHESSIIQTSAEGCPPGTPDFLNMALSGLWRGSPESLLALTQSIEVELGRPLNHGHWESRTVDIDIILFGDLIYHTQTLTIPHPLMCDRSFVLRPVSELLPARSIPGMGVTVAEALTHLESSQA